MDKKYTYDTLCFVKNVEIKEIFIKADYFFITTNDDHYLKCRKGNTTYLIQKGGKKMKRILEITFDYDEETTRISANVIKLNSLNKQTIIQILEEFLENYRKEE